MLRKMFLGLVCLLLGTSLMLGMGSAGAYAAEINVPGNYSTIQLAVNAANPGDTIKVAPGNYAGAKITKPLIIEGSVGTNGKPNSIIITGVKYCVTASTSTVTFGFVITTSNVSVSHFKFTCINPPGGSKYFGAIGTYADGPVENIKIHDNEIVGTPGWSESRGAHYRPLIGVYLIPTKNSEITRNTFTDIRQSIVMYSYSFPNSPSDPSDRGYTVSNNTVEANTIDVSGGVSGDLHANAERPIEGICLNVWSGWATDYIPANCYFDNCASKEVYTYRGVFSNNWIMNNTITIPSYGDQAIELLAEDHYTDPKTNNAYSLWPDSPEKCGIVSDNYITGNIIISSGNYGIWTYGSCDRNTFSGNDFSGSNAAIASVLLSGRATGNTVNETLFPSGTTVCTQVKDMTDNLATPCYDGSNTILGRLPIANAGPDQNDVVDQTCPLGSERVTLDGSGSYDPCDGGPLSYSWKEGATVLSTLESFSHDFAVGPHNITLTVTDNCNLTASDDVVVTVLAYDSACDPVAMINDIIADVNRIGPNNQNGLTAKLDAAKAAYENIRGKDYNAAINKIEAFINACNADSLLSAADRACLVGKANCVIGCIRNM